MGHFDELMMEQLLLLQQKGYDERSLRWPVPVGSILQVVRRQLQQVFYRSDTRPESVFTVICQYEAMDRRASLILNYSFSHSTQALRITDLDIIYKGQAVRLPLLGPEDLPHSSDTPLIWQALARQSYRYRQRMIAGRMSQYKNK